MSLIYSLLFMLNEMSPYILFGFFLAGVLYAYVPRSVMARHLAGRDFKSVAKAALIGVPLPLCSCGVLPTAIGMRRSGASRAATTSFLISTPQTGVDSIAATASLLGPAFAVIRPVAALITGVLGGWAVGRAEKAEPAAAECVAEEADERPRGFWRRLVSALRYGFVDLVASIGSWLVVGLVIAALITVYVPADFFSFMGHNPLLSMIAVLIIAVPMYVCATGSIPIALSLMLKGLSPGTALVLLMAGPAANFASFTLISREMGRKPAAIYLSAIIVGSVAFGLMIDYLLPESWFGISEARMTGACHEHFPLFPTICSGVLVALLLWAFIRRFTNKKQLDMNTPTSTYNVKGMNCAHCQATVTKAIAAVPGVTDVAVDLGSGRATVQGDYDPAAVRKAVSDAGFEIVD